MDHYPQLCHNWREANLDINDLNSVILYDLWKTNINKNMSMIKSITVVRPKEIMVNWDCIMSWLNNVPQNHQPSLICWTTNGTAKREQYQGILHHRKIQTPDVCSTNLCGSNIGSDVAFTQRRVLPTSDRFFLANLIPRKTHLRYLPLKWTNHNQSSTISPGSPRPPNWFNKAVTKGHRRPPIIQAPRLIEWHPLTARGVRKVLHPGGLGTSRPPTEPLFSQRNRSITWRIPSGSPGTFLH